MKHNKMSDRRAKMDRPANGELENRQFYQMFKKMYLDTESSDVNFVCAGLDGGTELVPAHQLLLSTASEGFKKMFAEAEPNQTEFILEQTQVAAFKEFLQFFYMPKIKLSIENIGAVMQLANNYGNDECLFLCGLFLEPRLTTENMIWGYTLAIRFGRAKMKEFCERKIAESSGDVFKSNCFLDCERDILKKILEFDALKCDEFQVLTGCLTWAKASADRKGLDSKNAQILRLELGDLLYQIRFRSMSMECFSMIVGTYAGFFSAEELEQIIQMIASKDFSSEKFNNKFRGTVKMNDSNGGGGGGGKGGNGGTMECIRFNSYTTSHYYVRPLEKTRFMANKSVILNGFDCGLVFSTTKEKVNLPCKVTIVKGPTDDTPIPTTIFTGQTVLTSINESHFMLDHPLPIQRDCKYEIQLEQPATKDHFNQLLLHRNVELKDGTKIRFVSEGNGWDDAKFGLITKLYFKRA